MSRSKNYLVAVILFAVLSTMLPSQANADGPLRRWWRNITGRNACACQNRTVPATVPVTANYNGYNLQPGQCMKTCQQTCTRTVVNYVPQTAYRTVYNRVPVTQYRPVTNTDPCTGCTVTCMRPCTSYTYQVQRVPYTTYRPVYRQESYRVPVTTITNDCANGTCGLPSTGCSTCATNGTQNFAPTLAPTTAQPPASTSSIYYESPTPTSTQGATTPADLTPSLGSIQNPQTSQRPSYPSVDPAARIRSYRTSSPRTINDQMNQPSVVQFNNQTASNQLRSTFGYSPIRTASSRYQTTYASRSASASQSRWVED